MSLAFERRVINATTPTSTGIVVYSVSPGGMGVPKAAVITANHAATAGTIANGWGQSWGVTDGTNQRCAYSWAKDATSVTVAKSAGHNASIVRIVDPSTSTIVVEGVLSAFANDSISINWTTVDSTAWQFSILLLGGTQFSSLAGNVTPPASSGATTVTPGWATDFVLTHTVASLDGTAMQQSEFAPGFSFKNAGSPVNFCQQAYNDDGVTTSEARTNATTSGLGTLVDLQVGANITTGTTLINNYTSTSFDVVNADNATQGPSLIYLAVSLAGAVTVHIATNDGTTPTSTGNQAYTWPGFKTGLLYIIFGNNTATADQGNANAGVGFADMLSNASASSSYSKTAITSPHKTSTLLSTGVVMDQYNIDRTRIYAATIVSKDQTGHTLNFNPAGASGRKFYSLAVEDAPDGLPWNPQELPQQEQPLEQFDSFFAPFALAITAAGGFHASHQAPLAAPFDEILGAFERPVDESARYAGWMPPELVLLPEFPAEILGSSDRSIDVTSDYLSWRHEDVFQLADVPAEQFSLGVLQAQDSSSSVVTMPLVSDVFAPEDVAEILTAFDLRWRIGAVSAGMQSFVLDAPDALPLDDILGSWDSAQDDRSLYAPWLPQEVGIGAQVDEFRHEAFVLPEEDPRAYPSWLARELPFAAEQPATIDPAASTWLTTLPSGPGLAQPWHQPDFVLLPEFVPEILGSVLEIPTLPGVATSAGFYEGLSNTIRARIDSTLSIPVQYDNEAFDPPADGIWARATINGGQTEEIFTAAGNGYRTSGTFTVSFFEPIERGDKTILAQADILRAAFREVSASGVRFRAATMQRRGRDADSYVIDVRCPYYIDQTVPIAQGSPGNPDLEEIGNIVRSRFAARVAAIQSLSTQYDNQAFSPDNLAHWARITVLTGEQRLVGSGPTARFRNVGMLVVNLFGELERGDRALLQLADAVATEFRSVTDRGVTFRSPSVKPIGRSGSWWQINVSCPFFADELAAVSP